MKIHLGEDMRAQIMGRPHSEAVLQAARAAKRMEDTTISGFQFERIDGEIVLRHNPDWAPQDGPSWDALLVHEFDWAFPGSTVCGVNGPDNSDGFLAEWVSDPLFSDKGAPSAWELLKAYFAKGKA